MEVNIKIESLARLRYLWQKSKKDARKMEDRRSSKSSLLSYKGAPEEESAAVLPPPPQSKAGLFTVKIRGRNLKDPKGGQTPIHDPTCLVSVGKENHNLQLPLRWEAID